jgi:Predicted butyrate kinase
VKPEAVYLSGRFLRIPLFARDLERRLVDLFENFGWKVEIAVLGSMGKVAKQAAEGAALMANGLAGGKYRKLIDVLGLKESKGSIFEYVTVVDKNRLLEKFGRMES